MGIAEALMAYNEHIVISLPASFAPVFPTLIYKTYWSFLSKKAPPTGGALFNSVKRIYSDLQACAFVSKP